MSADGNKMTLQLTAGADLNTGDGTGAQYKALAVGGTIAGTNALSVGLLQNKPKSGEDATVAYFGHMKGVAGGALTAGNKCKVTTSGYLAAVNSGDGACGKVITTCASGATVEIIADFTHAADTY